MSFTAKLWKDYKHHEQQAFDMVFGDAKPSIPVTHLVSNLENFLQKCHRRKKNFIYNHLQSAVGLREQAMKEYRAFHRRALRHGDYTSAARLQDAIIKHEHYLLSITAILPKQISRKGATQLEQTKESPNKTGTATYGSTYFSSDDQELLHYEPTESPASAKSDGLYKSLDEVDFESFCSMLDIWLAEIAGLWKGLVQNEIGYSISVATAVTYCIYNEVKAYLAAAQLLSPHWFDAAFLTNKEHPSQEEYKTILRYFDRKGDAFIDSLGMQAIKIDSRVVPDFLYDFLRSLGEIRDRQNLGFNTFFSSVVLRIFRQIASILGNGKSRFEQIRSSVIANLHYLDRVVKRHKVLHGDVANFLEQVQNLGARLPEITELSLVCGISLFIDTHLKEVFWMLLENPLVTMAAHIYIYLRLLNRVDRISQLDSFCQKHDTILFWNGQPGSMDEWFISVDKWIFVNEAKGAQRLARSRRNQTETISRQLAINGFRLQTDILKTLSGQSGYVFDSLRLKLENENNIIDIASLYHDIFRIISSQMGENITEADAVNHLYLNRDNEKWIVSFIQDLSFFQYG